jgi:hypothetical protein
VMELELKPARPEAESWIERQSQARSANSEHRPKRSLDCAAMVRMPLPSLLYYVLVGEGRAARFSSAG